MRAECSLGANWQNRTHFYGVSAQLMRHILVDFARTENFAKRGGKICVVSLAEAADVLHETGPDLVALDAALDKLAAGRRAASPAGLPHAPVF